jgi:hypothetical protein
MRQFQLKPALGGVCLAAALALGSGCGLALLCAGSELDGVSPLHIAALALTAALAGAGVDLIGRGPKAGDDGEGVAKSIWATQDHLEQFDILEG